METTTAPGWYPDPQMAGTVRYWDGIAWTAQVAPMPPAPAAAPATDLGPRSGLHWVVPVGRSWQSVTAGYLAFLCLIAWIGGPFGVAVGGVTLWLGIWAVQKARTGGHGRGRAVFGIVAGALSVVVGLAITVLWLGVL